MRLGRYVEILELNIPRLTFGTQSAPPNGILISNINNLILAVQSMMAIPSLESSAAELMSTIPSPDKTGSAYVHTTTLSELQKKLQNLQIKTQQLLDALKLITAQSDENTIYFKMPSNLDLENLSKVITTIDISLKQILGVVSPSTSIQFRGFDTGSAWLVLGVIGKTGLVLKALDYAMSLAAKGLDLKKQYIEVESQSIDLELKKEQAKIHKALLKALTDQYANTLLVDRENTNGTEEDVVRLANALTKLKEIMQKGGNIEIPLITSTQNPEPAKSITATASKLEHMPPDLLEPPKKDEE